MLLLQTVLKSNKVLAYVFKNAKMQRYCLNVNFRQ